MKRALLLLAVACGAVQAEVIAVFGLPLGGKLSKPIPVCTFNQVADQRTFCWVDRPFKHSGVQLGHIQLPETALPEWAAYSTKKLTLEKDGSVGSIVIYTAGKERNYKKLIQSISDRFGPASIVEDNPLSLKANWSAQGIHVHYWAVHGKHSEVTFRSPENVARNAEEARKARISRPATP